MADEISPGVLKVEHCPIGTIEARFECPGEPPAIATFTIDSASEAGAVVEVTPSFNS